MTPKEIAAELLAIRTNILRCLDSEHADRQTALEDAEEALARLHRKVLA